MEWKSISDGGENKGGDDSARQKCDHRRENREAGDGLRMAESFAPGSPFSFRFPFCVAVICPMLLPRSLGANFCSSLPPLFARARENKLW